VTLFVDRSVYWRRARWANIKSSGKVSLISAVAMALSKELQFRMSVSRPRAEDQTWTKLISWRACSMDILISLLRVIPMNRSPRTLAGSPRGQGSLGIRSIIRQRRQQIVSGSINCSERHYSPFLRSALDLPHNHLMSISDVITQPAGPYKCGRDEKGQVLQRSHRAAGDHPSHPMPEGLVRAEPALFAAAWHLLRA
jgi:hypothetical protein